MQSNGGAHMDRVKLSEDLRPLSDLETQPSEIVQQIRTTGRPMPNEVRNENSLHDIRLTNGQDDL